MTRMYAVIDTNVLVAAMLTRNPNSPTVQIYDCIEGGVIVPMYNDEIIAEYKDVLSREKFHFSMEVIEDTLALIVEKGISATRFLYEEPMIDEKDRVFYEVTLSNDESFLVTGNKKHFPITPQVVTPSEMIAIIQSAI